LHTVRDGAVLDAGNTEEVLLRFLNTLGNSRGNFLGLAVPDADHTVTVTNNDQSGEAETTAALHHLGNTVNGNNVLNVLVFFLFACAVVLTVTATATLAAVAAAIFALLGGLSGFSYGCFAHLSFLFVLLAH
jgi:hypothetical protein